MGRQTRKRIVSLAPVRHCRECGGDVYSWTEAPLCKRCLANVFDNPPAESLTQYRRRVKPNG